MFAPLRRSSYRPIEEAEEEEEEPAQLSNSLVDPTSAAGTAGQSTHFGADKFRRDEDGSAPSLQNHGCAVSFKCGKDPEQSSVREERARQWDHVGDVDQFFAFIYEYYQQKGFLCIALKYIFSLFRFAFVVIFSTFLLQCVDYDVLFYNRNVTLSGDPLPSKRRIQDSFIPHCPSQLNSLVKIALFFACLFWIGHFVRICFRLVHFYDIKHFFATQLQIHDNEMPNISWGQVVQKLCEAQSRIHLIVNKEAICPLDIYQRILRHRNYFVAFVYKCILPPQICLPIAGRVHYLSSGLRFNLEWLLFWGPWSPWKSSYAIKDEYRDKDNLERIARSMRWTLTIMAIVNLLFFPFVFVYQVLFSFFSYSELFQRDPNMLGMRKYSNYGREKLRHFNEMDHELDARLNRSYEFAVRYTDQFVSPLAKIIAKSFAFVAASIFVVLCALTAYDEDTLKIEHLTTMITITGGIVLACRVFIPNEHLVFCQQLLMRQIVANIHYAPKTWLRKAHSTQICAEFAQIFRLKSELLAEELLSPLLTPFILYFCIRPRALDIVTFFHQHTVRIDGLGDVCSFAQMDISRDGDARIASMNQSLVVQKGTELKNRQRNACGKAELSLLNFATQNPDWIPSKECAEFIRYVKELVAHEISVASHQQNSQNHEDDPQQESMMDPPTLALLQAFTHSSLPQMEQTQQRCLISNILPMGGNSQMLLGSSVLTEPPLGESEKNSMENVNNKQTTASINGQSTMGPPPPLSASIAYDTVSTRRLYPHSQQQQSFMFTNPQLAASSFIQPSPLATIVQPRVIQESNMRALEMSMQALAVNKMLLLNTPPSSSMSSQQQHQSRHPIMNRLRGVGYGSILLGASMRGGGGGPFVLDSLAESNIFGVPAGASQIQFPEEDVQRI